MSGAAASFPRIFISHSHEDNAFGIKLVSDLRAALGGDEATVWYDVSGGLHPGEAWWEKIVAEISARPIFLVVLSPDAMRSKWVNDEVTIAWTLKNHEPNRLIVPLLWREAQVRADLRMLQWVTFAAPHAYETALAELVARLRQHAQQMGVPIDVPAGPVQPVFAPAQPGPAPAPPGAKSASHLTPMPLYNLGFRGWEVSGVECILPPICPVPGGVFTMGSDKSQDKQAEDRETPQYPIEVESFSIGQHPVTVAEYARAVRAKAVPEPPEGWIKTDWKTQLGRLDHPVVNISWRDALAYTRWLTTTTGQPWRLPTEAEWEKAARWDVARQTSRIYPWGDTFDKDRCNTSESGIGATTPVGRYPTGASPWGAQDMAGNVWEWTSTLLKPYPYIQNDGREDLNSTGNRVLRGGSWCGDPRDARAAYRGRRGPGGLSGSFGFRLLLAAPDSSQLAR